MSALNNPKVDMEELGTYYMDLKTLLVTYPDYQTKLFASKNNEEYRINMDMLKFLSQCINKLGNKIVKKYNFRFYARNNNELLIELEQFKNHFAQGGV